MAEKSVTWFRLVGTLPIQTIYLRQSKGERRYWGKYEELHQGLPERTRDQQVEGVGERDIREAKSHVKRLVALNF